MHTVLAGRSDEVQACIDGGWLLDCKRLALVGFKVVKLDCLFAGQAYSQNGSVRGISNLQTGSAFAEFAGTRNYQSSKSVADLIRCHSGTTVYRRSSAGS